MSESALELASSLDLRETLLATAKRLCESVGVPECEITVVEGDGLRTLMRIARGHVDEEWIGQYLPMADASVTREVIETKRPTVVGSLRDPRLTASARDQPGRCAQELGDSAADRQGPRDRHRRTRRERRRAHLHAPGARHRDGHLPRRRDGHRERRAVRKRAAAGARDAAAQRDRAAHGRQPRPRRDRRGGRRRAAQLLPFDSHSLVLAESDASSASSLRAPRRETLARRSSSSDLASRLPRAHREQRVRRAAPAGGPARAGGLPGHRRRRGRPSPSRCPPTPASSAPST